MYKKQLPVRELPALGQLYSMSRRDLLLMLTQCPESRFFTQPKPKFKRPDALAQALELVSRMTYDVQEVIP